MKQVKEIQEELDKLSPHKIKHTEKVGCSSVVADTFDYKCISGVWGAVWGPLVRAEHRTCPELGVGCQGTDSETRFLSL